MHTISSHHSTLRNGEISRYAKTLKNDIGIQTFIDNDAKALALAEGWLGAAKNDTNFIAMVVSTGIGGGIVLNGNLLEGAEGNAGHIGHVFVQQDTGEDALV